MNLMIPFQYSKLLFFVNIVAYFLLSKQIWILYDQLLFSFHMKVNRCRHLFSIGGQLFTFIGKFYEGKNSNFDRRVFIQGVSENTDTFLSFPALVLIIAQTLLGVRITSISIGPV